jgi:2-phospho-L-lactate guanylyltransferase
MILVPIKNLQNAKQRLSPALDAWVRTDLAQTMLVDVLNAIAQSECDDVALVTSDPFAMKLAAQNGFEVIRDDCNLSETDAITMATGICVARRVHTTLVVPGDIPLIEAEDVRAIYEHASDTGSVLVPSSDKRGSNAVLRRPAALFPLRFGNDSFMPHLTAAIATNTSCVVLSLPRIGLDIDNPEDLRQLAEAAGNKPSQVLARKFVQADERLIRAAADAHSRVAAES